MHQTSFIWTIIVLDPRYVVGEATKMKPKFSSAFPLEIAIECNKVTKIPLPKLAGSSEAKLTVD